MFPSSFACANGLSNRPNLIMDVYVGFQQHCRFIHNEQNIPYIHYICNARFEYEGKYISPVHNN